MILVFSTLRAFPNISSDSDQAKGMTYPDVECLSQPIAAVAATSLDIAREASGAIKVRYNEKAYVIDAKSIEDAVQQATSTVADAVYDPTGKASVFKSGGVDVWDLVKERLLAPELIVMCVTYLVSTRFSLMRKLDSRSVLMYFWLI